MLKLIGGFTLAAVAALTPVHGEVIFSNFGPGYSHGTLAWTIGNMNLAPAFAESFTSTETASFWYANLRMLATLTVGTTYWIVATSSNPLHEDEGWYQNNTGDSHGMLGGPSGLSGLAPITGASGALEVDLAPEPGTFVLLSSVIAVFGLRRRKTGAKKQSQP